jgi:hypothetical protein
MKIPHQDSASYRVLKALHVNGPMTLGDLVLAAKTNHRNVSQIAVLHNLSTDCPSHYQLPQEYIDHFNGVSLPPPRVALVPARSVDIWSKEMDGAKYVAGMRRRTA